MNCDIENKTIKKELSKCQKFCSLFQPKFSYLEKDINDMADEYLSKYKKCFEKCVEDYKNNKSYKYY
jgi:hypothetical protein